jgi:hypothetical protein
LPIITSVDLMMTRTVSPGWRFRCSTDDRDNDIGHDRAQFGRDDFAGPIIMNNTQPLVKIRRFCAIAVVASPRRDPGALTNRNWRIHPGD